VLSGPEFGPTFFKLWRESCP